MRKSECPACGSPHTVKNGKVRGVQTYLCRACGHRFRPRRIPTAEEMWEMYVSRKQTVAEIASACGTSPSTVKRRLRGVTSEWEQPSLSGSGFVHLDATYWGRNSGVLLAIDSRTGRVLYLAFIRHEKVSDYQSAVESIESRGYAVRGIVIDGMPHLFKAFSGRKIQMCQFHMMQIIRRYLTRHPRLLAARELGSLASSMTHAGEGEFTAEYLSWKPKWKDTLERRTECKDGKRRYRHRRLRSAVRSLDFYLPYLFTFQRPDCTGMPNTNNKLEGTFTDLSNNLNSHSGMTEASRERFIAAFFSGDGEENFRENGVWSRP